MFESHRQPASSGWIRTGPRIGHSEEPRSHRPVFDDETTVPVHDSAVGKHIGDRLDSEPGRVQRAGFDHLGPYISVLEALQRAVGARSEDGDRPGVVVAREPKNRNRSDRREWGTDHLRNGPGEVPGVVAETAVRAGLLGRPRSRGHQPVAGLGPPSHCIDYRVGGDLLTVRGAYTGDVRNARTHRSTAHQTGRAHPATDPDAWVILCRSCEHELPRRAPGGPELEPLILGACRGIGEQGKQPADNVPPVRSSLG